GGTTEHPAPGEVTYADSADRAHARRWTNRQSGHSAVGGHTRRILVVMEAVHDGGADTVAEALRTIARDLTALWPADPATALLTPARPEFVLDEESLSGTGAP
ncbi:MAG TPA: hypothetical protein VKZ89_14090, partial [Thermobifida alba]|nr:hypothetical protein [Thermobifida alba]